MSEGDSKTINNITVVIHRITETQVYYSQGSASKPIEEHALVRRHRAEFERLWETET